MAYRIKRKESPEEGVKRILEEQISKAEDELPEPNAPDLHDAVHQSRKRCKKVRALYRLIRPRAPKAFKRENARFRDVARELSKVRDAEAMIECYDRVLDRFSESITDRRPFAAIRRRLTLRRKSIAQDEVDIAAKVDRFREELARARQALDDWAIPDGDFGAVGEGLLKTYQRGRVAMRVAKGSPTDANLHEWRKRAKYHRFHLRALRGVWPEVLEAEEGEADKLAELLGEDHDLAVLKSLLHAESESFNKKSDLPAFLALVERRRLELQDQARSVGARVFAESPKALAKRLNRLWKAWRRKRKVSKL